MIASGCATTAQTPADRSYKPISGSIPLDSSIILKKAVAVEIQLLDVTIPSEEAKQLSKQIIKNPKKTPVNFSLRFEETDIQAFGSYVVRLAVFEGETKIYESLRDIGVLTKGNPDTIDIPLRQIY